MSDEKTVDPREAKYPELMAHRRKLEAERDAILAKTAGLRAQRDALNEQVQPTLGEIRDLTAEIREVEQPRLHTVLNQLAALSRAMGAHGTREAK